MWLLSDIVVIIDCLLGDHVVLSLVKGQCLLNMEYESTTMIEDTLLYYSLHPHNLMLIVPRSIPTCGAAHLHQLASAQHNSPSPTLTN